MPIQNKKDEQIVKERFDSDYKAGFTTNVESNTLPPGLNEDVVAKISKMNALLGSISIFVLYLLIRLSSWGVPVRSRGGYIDAGHECILITRRPRMLIIY